MSLAKAMLANARRLLSGKPPKPAEAGVIVNEVLRSRPDDPEALALLWDIAGRTSEFESLTRALATAAARDSHSADLQLQLSRALLQAGRGAEAESAARAAIGLAGADAPAHLHLANVLMVLGQREEAFESGRRAAALAPGSAAMWSGLGALLQTHRKDEAVQAIQRALAIEPGNPHLMIQCAQVLRSAGRMAEAEQHLRRAVAASPRLAEAHWHLGAVIAEMGSAEEGCRSLRRAVELDPSSLLIRSAYVSLLNYITDDGSLMREEHRRFGIQLEDATRVMPSVARSEDPERRLRVGFLSGDMRSHSCMHFLLPPFEGLGRERFEVIGIAASGRHDAVTDRFKAAAQGWLSVADVSTQSASERIRDAGIDILIECHGHTDLSRLDICAAKPAPVQMTFLGYPNTTGLKRIDYRLVDALSDPPGAEAHCEERLLRIPECLWCFRPFPEAPLPSERTPALVSGSVTLGSFNNLIKINQPTIAAWAEILRRLPTARLLMKNRRVEDPAVFERILARFEAAGVSRDRVRAVPFTQSTAEHLRVYEQIDFQLDPFPYNGTTTTCESLWQGVPIVALEGRVHAARVSRSLLHAVGLDDLVAPTVEAYIDAAVRLAGDTDRLQDLRTALRRRMARSPLRDESGYSRRFGEALRTAWRDHCVVS